MIKTKTIETVEEFDENGKLVKKTTTEREETDDSPTSYKYVTIPYHPAKGIDTTGYDPALYPSGGTFCSEGQK